MYIVGILYSLGNNKKKSVCVQYRCIFFLNIFDLPLIESTDEEFIDTEGQLYFYMYCIIDLHSNCLRDTGQDVTVLILQVRKGLLCLNS